MAKASFIQLSPEQEAPFFSTLQYGDRFTFGKIIQKNKNISRKKIKGLTARSLLPQVAVVWNALADSDKLEWKNCAEQCAMTGYHLFVQNMCARLQYGLTGAGVPSLLHQYKIGQIVIASPATLCVIWQLHPLSYWVLKKVVGSKSMYSPVNIKENFSLPIEISLNYKSDLTACGDNPSAKFYAKIWFSYQGVDNYYHLEIDLNLATDWVNATSAIDSIPGQVIGYDLYFTLQDVRGTLEFDNLKAEHSGQNWVRGFACNDIDVRLTKAFYQIPKDWAPVEMPNGASYGSVFPDVV